MLNCVPPHTIGTPLAHNSETNTRRTQFMPVGRFDFYVPGWGCAEIREWACAEIRELACAEKYIQLTLHFCIWAYTSEEDIQLTLHLCIWGIHS